MKRFLIWIGTLVLTLGVEAQTYATRRLEMMGADFPSDCLPEVDSVFRCPKLLAGRALVVEYDAAQSITHLGVSLFSSETQEAIGRPVCRFMERVMLDLVLQRNAAGVQETMRDYRIRLQRNGVDFGRGGFTSVGRALEAIPEAVRFSVIRTTEYAAVWEYGSDTLKLVFPAERELIFGTDKKEAEEALNDWLAAGGDGNCAEATADEATTTDEGLVAHHSRKLFTKKGRFFVDRRLTEDTYFVAEDAGYRVLISKEYPLESLSNMILCNLNPMELRLHLRHRMYGFRQPEFEMGLRDFVCRFRGDFDIYAAPLEANEGVLRLSVVLHHADFNYSHLLLIRVPADVLFEAGGVLEADFYSHVPQQNIKDLLADRPSK